MHESLHEPMLDLIVYAVLVMVGVFVAAWAISPAMRRRIEAPKFQFIERLQRWQRYDEGDHD